MQHIQPTKWHQQLQWKLSLLYTLVTVVSILIGLGISEVGGYYRYRFLILTALVSIGGLGFSLVTARYLLVRLKVITTAVDAWGRSEFSVVADDGATGEMGQLAHRLNLMAKDLQGVFALRQGLATLEERVRLVRDLHDTVKQQVFALAMQIGAARRMFDGSQGNSSEIGKRLLEAEEMARQVQNELVAIIRELQPPDRAGKKFEWISIESMADSPRQSEMAPERKHPLLSTLPSTVE